MATPRYLLVDPQVPMHYHLVSRCVRRSFLCGRDPNTSKDYSHRKTWLIQRLFHLARYFAVEIDAFAIMSNHFHLVVYYDPTACLSWGDDEVAERWVEAFPPTQNGDVVDDLKPLMREKIIGNPERLQAVRQKLGCLSTFMKHLKQPIAWRANQQDGCQGHFFEQRFYSGALLSEAAILAAMAYVDLNPVRAKIAENLRGCRNTSIEARLRENTPGRLRAAIAPLVSGLSDVNKRFSLTLLDYVARLNQVIRLELGKPAFEHPTPGSVARWCTQVAALRKRQRAYGAQTQLQTWLAERNLSRREVALPE